MPSDVFGFPSEYQFCKIMPENRYNEYKNRESCNTPIPNSYAKQFLIRIELYRNEIEHDEKRRTAAARSKVQQARSLNSQRAPHRSEQSREQRKIRRTEQVSSVNKRAKE